MVKAALVHIPRTVKTELAGSLDGTQRDKTEELIFFVYTSVFLLFSGALYTKRLPRRALGMHEFNWLFAMCMTTRDHATREGHRETAYSLEIIGLSSPQNSFVFGKCTQLGLESVYCCVCEAGRHPLLRRI
jgi:hypothetical protein